MASKNTSVTAESDLTLVLISQFCITFNCKDNIGFNFHFFTAKDGPKKGSLSDIHFLKKKSEANLSMASLYLKSH